MCYLFNETILFTSNATCFPCFYMKPLWKRNVYLHIQIYIISWITYLKYVYKPILVVMWFHLNYSLLLTLVTEKWLLYACQQLLLVNTFYNFRYTFIFTHAHTKSKNLLLIHRVCVCVCRIGNPCGYSRIDNLHILLKHSIKYIILDHL